MGDDRAEASWHKVLKIRTNIDNPLSDDHVRQLCAVADANGDGAIDYEEFARAVEDLGFDTGFVLGVQYFDGPGEEKWPGMRSTFRVLNSMFNILFTIEVLLRLAVHRLGANVVGDVAPKAARAVVAARVAVRASA